MIRSSSVLVPSSRVLPKQCLICILALMSNPRPAKKARVLTSDVNLPSTSTSSASTAVNVTCTNNNARRLAHSVTLKLKKNHGVRCQAQSARSITHVSNTSPTDVNNEIGSEDMAGGSDGTMASGSGGTMESAAGAVPSGSQAESESTGPKRPAVCACTGLFRF